MLLHEALLQSECPICLQPLNFAVPPPPSRPASPFSAISSSASPPSLTSPNYVSSAIHSPISPPNRSTDLDTDGEFHITFAPGVYGSDAADPWFPSFEILSSVPGSQSRSSAPGERRLTSSSLPESHTTGAGSKEGHGDDTATHESASGVVVLPCGHLLHYPCAMQLCEYATHPSCPVCRAKLSSVVDLTPLCPRLRAPHRATTTTTAGAQVPPPCDVEAVRGRGAANERKRRRGDAEAEGCTLSAEPPDAEGSNDATVISDEDKEKPPGAGEALLGGAELTNMGRAAARSAMPLEHVRRVSASLVVIGPSSGASSNVASPSTLVNNVSQALGRASPRTTSPDADGRVDTKHHSAEDDILILGARQLPPAQAYAELLLRTTATWASRADVLKTRVAHLEKSQQQLQNDCAELGRTLSAARRRRELLLNLPCASTASADSTDALPSFERLRELRRLCGDTRAAMAEATAQLAASTREHAEVRRQIEKYSRKLARVKAGDDVEEAKNGSSARRHPHKPPRSSEATGDGNGDASRQSGSKSEPQVL
ncbi:hypothetical protein ABL78_7733 [Leptomonas seymouri]|uniref:RING-type domain-containing protein n=1 Tax=Leptomonas seymouri TaxID=5684 RepID=A0A0N1I1J9_LEPSE|nr:hypothetical protein ABL78_7733 [Leptomonas seymouri]|eukprot:KPI83243.1 hypothetical protein ABL78_7733 [Leptomonas seymouri]